MPENRLDILKPIRAIKRIIQNKPRDEEVKRSHISGSQPTDRSEQLPDIPEISWRTSFNDWIDWLSNQYYSWKEYFSPSHLRDHQPLDERDKKILETQEKMRRLRKELDRQGVHREQTIRENYEDDIARVQQKKKICTNWHDEEIDYMKDKKKQSLGIVPEISADYSKTPGWEVSRGETNYRGQKELCQNLQCSDTNLGSPQVGVTDSFLKYMEKEGERYSRISQQLKTCQDSLQDSLKEKSERTTRKLVDPYPARGRDWLPSPSDSDKELKTRFYSPTSSPELIIEQMGEWENILGHLLEVLLFPIKVSNRKAAIWRGGPPIWPLRLMCSGILLVIWYKFIVLFFELVH